MSISDNSFIKRRWKYYDLFDTELLITSQWDPTDNDDPSGDELHVIVYDTTGDITGFDSDVIPGNRTKGVIEIFGNMSKNPNNPKTGCQGSSILLSRCNFHSHNLFTGQIIFLFGSNWGSDTTTTYTSVVPITIDSLTEFWNR